MDERPLTAWTFKGNRPQMPSKITRTQFEECLEVSFEQMQPGLFNKVKQEIDGAWTVTMMIYTRKTQIVYHRRI